MTQVRLEQAPRTPAAVLRTASRAIQARLDHLASRCAPTGPLGKFTRWLARTWVTMWWITVTAFAASVAWALASLSQLANPVPAAVGAVLTVALSLNRSVKTGVSLVVATATALLVAFALYQVWGLHVWTAGVIVAVSLIIGLAMRLGKDGALQIPATALFVYVMGDGLTDDVIIHRILATLMGVVIGLAFSFVAHPERPEDRVTEQMTDIGGRLGDLLTQIGRTTAEGCTRRDAAEWLTTSRALAVEVRKLGDTLDDLALGSRISVPAGAQRRTRGQAIRDQFMMLQQTTSQVNDIARGLFDATARGDVSIPTSVGAMLTSTGAAIGIHAEAMSRTIDEGGDPPTGVLRALDIVVEDRSRSVATIKGLDDTGALLLGGSIVTEVDRMVDQLGGPAPASKSQKNP